MGKKLFFLPALLLAALAVVSAAILGAPDPSPLAIRDTTVAFQHFAYSLQPDHTMLSYDKTKIVSTVFKAKILENKYLRVTLVPEFGGRILSIIYKPTGHEELYQNPIGTPYGIGEGNFYYNWLMVYGGIFPTFPEPEHGKTWCLPWETRIVSAAPDEIGVEMSFRDDIPRAPGVPSRFNKGRTDLICTETVWLGKDTPYVKVRFKLENTRDQPAVYEYWTCATLAPGSEPGRTSCPGNSTIVAPITMVKSKDDWWRWMASVDKPIDAGRHIFEFKNLATFANWQDMGIAYAYPRMESNFWGVVNQENGEGLFRVADNAGATPGLKLWTWGWRQGTATDPQTFGNSARPYIELWAGHSLEFFANARLDAHAAKAWDEYYIPTAGLPGVSFANEHALAYLAYGRDKAGRDHLFTVRLFTTHPGETMDLLVRVSGAAEYVLHHGSFVGDPARALALDLAKTAPELEAGRYTLELILRSTSGEVLAQTGIPFEVR